MKSFLALALIPVLALPAGAGSVVLCLCQEGQMAVEAACAPEACCAAPEEAAPVDAPSPHTAGGLVRTADTCTFIPLPVGSGIMEARALASSPDSAAPQALAPAQARTQDHAQTIALPPPHSPPTDPLRPLRTVKLRT